LIVPELPIPFWLMLALVPSSRVASAGLADGSRASADAELEDVGAVDVADLVDRLAHRARIGLLGGRAVVVSVLVDGDGLNAAEVVVLQHRGIVAGSSLTDVGHVLRRCRSGKAEGKRNGNRYAAELFHCRSPIPVALG
jgi:hypothetical protein